MNCYTYNELWKIHVTKAYKKVAIKVAENISREANDLHSEGSIYTTVKRKAFFAIIN